MPKMLVLYKFPLIRQANGDVERMLFSKIEFQNFGINRERGRSTSPPTCMRIDTGSYADCCAEHEVEIEDKQAQQSPIAMKRLSTWLPEARMRKQG